jgi:hypothetical protein
MDGLGEHLLTAIPFYNHSPQVLYSLSQLPLRSCNVPPFLSASSELHLMKGANRNLAIVDHVPFILSLLLYPPLDMHLL